MSMNPDEVLAERLKDPSKWVVRRGVPVLKPHEYKSLTGQILYKVTAEELQEVARLTAQLESEEGVFGRLTPGHVALQTKTVKPDGSIEYTPADESKQPELFGFQRNYRMGTYGPKAKSCVVADEWYYPEHAGRAAKLPYRSPDYNFIKKQIRGTALLIRDPYQDMGTHAYSDGNGIIQLEQTMEPTAEEVATLKHLYDKYPDYCKKMCSMSAADDTVRMQAQQLAVQLAVQTNAVSQLQATVAELQKRETLAQCERDVIQLEAEGYLLVRADEVAELATKTDATARQSYLARVRANYKQDTHKANRPPEGTVQLYAGPVEGGAGEVAEKARHQKAGEIMRANPGMTFEQAYIKAA